ncbi:MAG: hypothetical protein DHS80DRAFT_30706 [Piptocephalis tieghemiana]|nr:MAG: hypothetical protein DHS80DRAFT_30706 [Piptocephalis tieghemiana]
MATTEYLDANDFFSDEEFYSDMDDEAQLSDSETDDSMKGDEDDLAIGFKPAEPPKKPLKSYEVAHWTVTEAELEARQRREADHVAGIINVTTGDAMTLLRYARWDKTRLTESYFNDPERISQEAGLRGSSPQHAPTIKRPPPGFVCDICCDDEVDSILALACHHAFCSSCYQRYLVQKVMVQAECRRILCPQKGCDAIVDPQTIETLLGLDEAQEGRLIARYRVLLTRTYVDDHVSLRWCPAPGCEYAVECPVSSKRDILTRVPTVQCASGHPFCHGCGMEEGPGGHQPCPCHLVRMWVRKLEDDSETANWLGANTKECPECHSITEKNGGCNHMTCRKCKHEYCWVCMGPWSEHGTQYYNCNRFDEDSSRTARDSQAQSRYALERYLHYFRRYDNHARSAALDKDLYDQTERKMEEMQRTSALTWIECQFLRKATDILLASRGTLKWTYAFAFYLERNNQTHLFEDNQRDLEMAVEQLSGMLMEDIPTAAAVNALRARVLDKSVYVDQRREVMLGDTAKGLSEGRWSFSTPESLSFK